MLNRRNIALILVSALLPCLLSFQADAQSNPNQRAEAEARSMLTKCKQPSPDLQQLCLRNQRDFIREYVRGKAGSEINIRGIASYLRPLSPLASDFEKSLRVGIPVSLLDACAWRLWHAMMQTDNEHLAGQPLTFEARIIANRRSWQPTCLQLHFDDRNVSLQQAVRLMDEYLSNPARLPPSDWRPKVAGLIEPKPRRPVPEECLITEAPPLNAPDDYPRQKLPKHCDAYH